MLFNSMHVLHRVLPFKCMYVLYTEVQLQVETHKESGTKNHRDKVQVRQYPGKSRWHAT